MEEDINIWSPDSESLDNCSAWEERWDTFQIFPKFRIPMEVGAVNKHSSGQVQEMGCRVSRWRRSPKTVGQWRVWEQGACSEVEPSLPAIGQAGEINLLLQVEEILGASFSLAVSLILSPLSIHSEWRVFYGEWSTCFAVEVSSWGWILYTRIFIKANLYLAHWTQLQIE